MQGQTPTPPCSCPPACLQLWDRRLKQQAADIIDDPSTWLPLYYMWDLRTAQGATGLLFRSWPGDWQVARHLFSSLLFYSLLFYSSLL